MTGEFEQYFKSEGSLVLLVDWSAFCFVSFSWCAVSSLSCVGASSKQASRHPICCPLHSLPSICHIHQGICTMILPRDGYPRQDSSSSVESSASGRDQMIIGVVFGGVAVVMSMLSLSSILIGCFYHERWGSTASHFTLSCQSSALFFSSDARSGSTNAVIAVSSNACSPITCPSPLPGTISIILTWKGASLILPNTRLRSPHRPIRNLSHVLINSNINLSRGSLRIPRQRISLFLCMTLPGTMGLMAWWASRCRILGSRLVCIGCRD